MDLRMFAACLIMTVFLSKHSDAATITAWTFTDAAGTGAADTGTAPMGVTTVSIAESTAVGGTLFTALATPNTATYAFDTTDGNPSDIATATISAAGVVTLASSFDFETTPSYVFKIVATDGGDTGTATVTLSITDSVQLTKTAFCLSSSSVAAGTSVGTITTDETAVTFGAPLTADFASFTVSTTTGAITVATRDSILCQTSILHLHHDSNYNDKRCRRQRNSKHLCTGQL
ncbi:cadherin EGF LAG seven-pass G-type receptor 2-like [Mya arenaria]|uniref:cadherin EGF LAG seven-pass G-type receptor 2-like n=1 Tax=Mya arenaria TaxID=6604 RepID=UPI0022E7F53D|nr:cadherin EGF LAG seven-pass G-type receptor 2-like [Mya arenaria]